MRTANRAEQVRQRLIVLVISALCCATLFVSGTIIPITNTSDSGAGSLRAALDGASNGDTIDASSVTGTIVLTSGQIHVTRSVAVIGSGAANLAVNGKATGRIFSIGPYIAVTISGLTITNGFVGFSSPQQRGGGIYNQSILILTGCVLSGNSAYFGGAIYNEGPCPTNMICVPESGDGKLTLNNCTLSGNFTFYGGGICNDGTASVVNSTLCRNEAGEGGGVFNEAPYTARGKVTIANSTFDNNLAGRGGGISSTSGSIGITSSTFSGNWSDDTSGFGGGGGIYNGSGFGSSSLLTVKFCTFSGNSAYANGGSIFNQGAANIGSTILNAGASGANLAGTITSLGYNLSSDSGGGHLTATGDQINTDPKLGSLQNNGGPTKAYALLPGSPAIDAGDPSFTPPPDFDQRGSGFPRVVDGRIDIGAFEFTPDLVVTAVDRIGDDLRLAFGVTLLGENYEVQSRTNLNFGSWESLPGSIGGSGSTAQITVTNAFSVPQQFFRIHQLP